MKCLILFALFVGCVLGGGVSFTDITLPFVPISANLPEPATDNNYIALYRLWVPANVSSVTVSISNAGSNCSYINFNQKTGSALCPEDYDENFSGNGICDQNQFTGADISQEESPYIYTFANYYRDLVEDDGTVYFKTGTYWYFSVFKYLDYESVCPFTINAVNLTYCPAGKVAAGLTGLEDAVNCITDHQVTLPWTGSAAGITDTQYVYSANLTGVKYGRIDIWINATTIDLTVYATTGAPTSTESYYDCENTNYQDYTGYYIYTSTCYTPVGAGRWYLSLFYDGGDSYDITSMKITPTICNTTGGWNCTAAVYAFDPANPPSTTYTIDATTPEGVEYPFIYFYTDITPANSGGFSFVANNTGVGYGELIVKANGYPEWETPFGYANGLEKSLGAHSVASYYLTAADLVVGGRIYFGIYADTYPMTINVYSAAVVVPTTTGSPTTANPATTTANPATTTANPATTGVNSASTVFVSSFLLAVIALVFFF